MPLALADEVVNFYHTSVSRSMSPSVCSGSSFHLGHAEVRAVCERAGEAFTPQVVQPLCLDLQVLAAWQSEGLAFAGHRQCYRRAASCTFCSLSWPLTSATWLLAPCHGTKSNQNPPWHSFISSLPFKSHRSCEYFWVASLQNIGSLRHSQWDLICLYRTQQNEALNLICSL